MELIRRDGSRVGICREHRKVFAGRRCPECAAEREAERRRYESFKRRLEEYGRRGTEERRTRVC